MSVLKEIYREYEETRRDSNMLHVLKALMEAGDTGISNIELTKLTHRFGSAIYTLRTEGFDIAMENMGGGVVQYYIRNYIPKPRKAVKKGADKLYDAMMQKGGVVTVWEMMSILEDNNLQVIHKPNGLNGKVNRREVAHA